MIKELVKNTPKNNTYSFLEKYIKEFDCFVAGGCFKDLIVGKVPKDIDLFFKSYDFAKQAISSARANSNYKFIRESDMCAEFLDKTTGLHIQIVTNHTFKTPEETLDNFDFTVSKFLMFKEEGGETKTLRHEDFFDDLRDKRLVLGKVTYPVHTLLRIIRYSEYGFSCENEDAISILIQIFEEVEMDELYEMFYH